MPPGGIIPNLFAEQEQKLAEPNCTQYFQVDRSKFLARFNVDRRLSYFHLELFWPNSHAKDARIRGLLQTPTHQSQRKSQPTWWQLELLRHKQGPGQVRLWQMFFGQCQLETYVFLIHFAMYLCRRLLEFSAFRLWKRSQAASGHWAVRQVLQRRQMRVFPRLPHCRRNLPCLLWQLWMLLRVQSPMYHQEWNPKNHAGDFEHHLLQPMHRTWVISLERWLCHFR